MKRGTDVYNGCHTAQVTHSRASRGTCKLHAGAFVSTSFKFTMYSFLYVSHGQSKAASSSRCPTGTENGMRGRGGSGRKVGMYVICRERLELNANEMLLPRLIVYDTVVTLQPRGKQSDISHTYEQRYWRSRHRETNAQRCNVGMYICIYSLRW